jgi:hypothetical protein
MRPLNDASLGRRVTYLTPPLDVMLLKFFDKTEAVNRLDQDHLHPNLEVPRLTCSGRESTHTEYQALATTP